jgi:hypothetical protein
VTSEKRRFLLEALVIIGCLLIILIENSAVTEAAAFGLLGVIVSSLVQNVER